MCGIAAISRGALTLELVEKNNRWAAIVAAALAHRGPDGQGQSADASLVHRRLAIIDPQGGQQPLYHEDITLVGNGEIYNYLELIAEHGLKDLPSASDFEPILRLYQTDPNFLQQLRGMYALAIKKEEKLLLARDPFGIKPLYYAKNEDGELMAASEPRALLAAGFGIKKADEGIANQLLHLNYSTGKYSIYPGIYRLLPGESLWVENGEIIEKKRQHPLAIKPANIPTDEQEALARLNVLLEESVVLHQRSDVPYGLFLSSGIDSSVLLTMMARVNERPVKSFTCGFVGEGVPDERPAAEKLANSLKAEHQEISFSAEDFWQFLPIIAHALDEPTADYAILPSWKLAGLAAQSVKVVLSGEGGDEIFGGYGRYRRAMRPWWLGGRAADPQGHHQASQFCRRSGRDWLDNWQKEATAFHLPEWSPLQKAQGSDIATWLPHDLLLKLDRCLMVHGLEGRTPYLDAQLSPFAFYLPDELKIKNKMGKYLLRSWLAKHAPQAQPFAPKKGFTVPVLGWMQSKQKFLAERLPGLDIIQHLMHPEKVAWLFNHLEEQYAGLAWSILFFAVWHAVHIEGVNPQGDVERVLRKASWSSY
ncbi:MAG: asparagine synthase (glutamine-hydrolyzing) [Alphaproteobacteria bacterium]